MFSDLDYTDRPVATELTSSIAAFEPDGITTLTLTADQQQSIEDAFTVHLSDDSTNNGAVHWTYSIDEVDLNFLAAGESVEAVFTVSIIDQIGASSSQDVSILLTGSNDAPTTLLSSVPLPSLAEDTSSQASIQDLLMAVEVMLLSPMPLMTIQAISLPVSPLLLMMPLIPRVIGSTKHPRVVLG